MSRKRYKNAKTRHKGFKINSKSTGRNSPKKMRNKNRKRWQWRDKEQDTQHLNNKTKKTAGSTTTRLEIMKKLDAKTETQNHQNETQRESNTRSKKEDEQEDI